MKHSIKSVISGLLALVMVFCIIPSGIFASEGLGPIILDPVPEETFDGTYRVDLKDVYVDFDEACKLGYIPGGEEKYKSLKCLEEDGIHKFYVSYGSSYATVLVVAGDTDLNGRLSQADSTKIKAYLKGSQTLEELQQFSGDVNHDGKITQADSTKIKAYLKGQAEIAWDLGIPVTYAVEHYFQTEAGSDEYIKDEECSYTDTEPEGSGVYAGEIFKAGYIYDFGNERNVRSGRLVQGEELTLMLFYKVDADGNLMPDDEQSYTVRFFDCDLTDGGLLMEAQYLWGTEVEDIARPAVEHEGYTFMGWEPEIETVTKDADYTAVFEANKDTPFKVEYYKQTEAGSGEFLKDELLTEYLTGVTDTTVVVTPQELLYYVFDESNPRNRTSGMIHPDGSLVLKLYYKVDSDNDGEADDEQSYTVTFLDYDETVLDYGIYFWGTMPDDISAPKPEREGYTHVGWMPEIEMVTGDAEYVAFYIPNPDTPYTVEYYMQKEAGSELYECDEALTEHCIGTTGEEVSAELKKVEYYVLDKNNENNVFEGKVLPDGSLVLKLYYKVDMDCNGEADDEQMYTISFVDSYEDAVISSKDYPWGTPAEDIEVPNADKEGYIFLGWDHEIVTVTCDAEYCALYEPKTDTPYMVEYHLQTQPGSGFEIDPERTEKLTGTTDTYVSKEPGEIEGYVFDEGNKSNVLSGYIKGDGSLVLSLYYRVDADGDGTPDDMQEYTVTFLDYDGSTLGSDTCAWGTPASEIDAPEPERAGYDFAGWDPELAAVTGDASYTAQYTAHTDTPYDILYYLQKQTGVNEFKVSEELSQHLFGTTGEEVSTEPIFIEGYAYDDGNKSNILGGVIKGDGSLDLVLYYRVDADGNGVPDDGDEYMLTFLDSEYGETIEVQFYKYGTLPSQITPPAASKEGYDFASWIPEITRVTGNATYYASYTPRNDTPYRIEHWKQSEAGGSEFVRDTSLTQNLKGTTEFYADADPLDLDGYVFDEDNEENVLNGCIMGDGSLVLAVYYKLDSDNDGVPDDEDSYTVTFVDEDGETVISSASYVWNTEVKDIVRPVAEKEGYQLFRWEPAEIPANYASYAEGRYMMYPVLGDITYVAHYVEDSDPAGLEFVLKEDDTYAVRITNNAPSVLVIPHYHEGKPVTSIASRNAWMTMDIQKLYIPSTVSLVSESSMYNVKLKEVYWEIDLYQCQTQITKVRHEAINNSGYDAIPLYVLDEPAGVPLSQISVSF